MNVVNPVSPAAALLVLAMPAVWLAGRALSSLVLDDRWSARLAAPGFAMALWILALHVAGLLSGSFHVALWAGTLIVAAGGITGFIFERRGRIVPPAPSWHPSRWMWVSAAVAVVLIVPMTVQWAFHDELFYTGHMSMTAAIQNGGYPPRSLSFPAYDLRYHYGFALLNAALTSILRVRIDTGIDLISLASWGYLFVLFWAMGDRLLGRGRGWITATITLFGGGIPFLCVNAGGPMAATLLGVCSIGGTYANPPFVSYFFQHPWAIGLPIALVLLGTIYSNGRPAARYPVMGMLLLALALCQFVLFVALGAALVAAEVFERQSVSIRRGLNMLAVSTMSLALATQLGGFFAKAATGTIAPLAPQAGVSDGLVASLVWHLVTFGLLLPLGLAGTVMMRRGRVLACCLIGGSLLIINFVQYPFSWAGRSGHLPGVSDIAKFGVVASLALSVAGSFAVSRVLALRPAPLAILAAGAALIGSLVAGLVFVGVITVDFPGIPEHPFSRSPVPVSRDDGATINWLRRHVEPGQVVFRDLPEALAYAQWGGLPQAWVDDMGSRFDPQSILEDRAQLLAELPTAPDAYLNRGVTWFVLDPEDAHLGAVVRTWVDDGRATLRATFGSLRVLKLLPPDGL